VEKASDYIGITPGVLGPSIAGALGIWDDGHGEGFCSTGVLVWFLGAGDGSWAGNCSIDLSLLFCFTQGSA